MWSVEFYGLKEAHLVKFFMTSDIMPLRLSLHSQLLLINIYGALYSFNLVLFHRDAVSGQDEVERRVFAVLVSSSFVARQSFYLREKRFQNQKNCLLSLKVGALRNSFMIKQSIFPLPSIDERSPA